MKHQNQLQLIKSKQIMKFFLLLTAIIPAYSCNTPQKSPVVIEWIAPAAASSVSNPLKDDAAAAQEGKKTFTQMCAVCHGEKGKGDGAAGIALTPKPGNFTLVKTQSQTDGAIFWKMSEGRAPMASYKAALSAVQRWQLVNYIRTFKK